jgi:hypothetical protein
MTWIRTVDESVATGALRQRYERDLGELGFVMMATKAFSANPALADAYHAFQQAIASQPGLSLREQRLIHAVVANRIHSMYCVLVYGARSSESWAARRGCDGCSWTTGAPGCRTARLPSSTTRWLWR